MATLGKIKQGEEEDLPVPEDLVKDKIKVKM